MNVPQVYVSKPAQKCKKINKLSQFLQLISNKKQSS